MPFYEYKCSECGEVFSLLQKHDAERQGYECPECGGKKTERVFSKFAVAVAGGATKSSGNGGGGHCCGPSCGCGH